MVVKAHPRTVKEIKDYVNALEDATMTQVVFDFTFVEYTNTSGAKGELNLDLVKNNIKVGNAAVQAGVSSSLTSSLLSDFNPISIGASVLTGDWTSSQVVIDALNRSGTTTVLAKPQIVSSHNKAAKLVKGEDNAIATTSTTTTTDGGSIQESGRVEYTQARVGIFLKMMNITPNILQLLSSIYLLY